MERMLTKQEVEGQLHQKKDDIDRRIDALQGEVQTLGTSIKEAVLRHPAVSAGGAVLAGVVVGLLTTRGRGRRAELKGTHRALVDTYVDAVADDARLAAAAGADAGDAVRQALQDRVPLIIYSEPSPVHRRGTLRQVLDLVWKTALGFLVKAGIDYATARLNLEQLGLPAETGADLGADTEPVPPVPVTVPQVPASAP